MFVTLLKPNIVRERVPLIQHANNRSKEQVSVEREDVVADAKMFHQRDISSGSVMVHWHCFESTL